MHTLCEGHGIRKGHHLRFWKPIVTIFFFSNIYAIISKSRCYSNSSNIATPGLWIHKSGGLGGVGGVFRVFGGLIQSWSHKWKRWFMRPGFLLARVFRLRLH